MKKVLFILASTGLICTSCKKSSSGDNNNSATPTNLIIETEGGVTSTHKGAGAIYGLSSFSGNYVMNITSLDAGKRQLN